MCIVSRSSLYRSAVAALMLFGLSAQSVPAQAATAFSVWADLNSKSETGVPFTPLFPALIWLGASSAAGFFGGNPSGPIVWGLVILDGNSAPGLSDLQGRLQGQYSCDEVESRELARLLVNASIRQKRESNPQVVTLDAMKKVAPSCSESLRKSGEEAITP